MPDRLAMISPAREPEFSRPDEQKRSDRPLLRLKLSAGRCRAAIEERLASAPPRREPVRERRA